MASTLLDSLRGLLTADQVARIAAMLGESEGGVSKALYAAFAAILAALFKKSSDPAGMSAIMSLLTDRANTPAVLGNIDSLLTRDQPRSAINDLGGSFLSTLFGSQLGSASGALSEQAGIKRDSASTLLSLAAPLVMATLGDRVRKDNLGGAGLASLLSSQRDTILNAAPPALASILGLSSLRGVGSAATTHAGAAAASSSRWVLPVLAAVVLLGGLWYLMRGRQMPEVKAPAVNVPQGAKDAMQGAKQMANQAAGAAGNAAQGAADAAGSAAANLGAFLTRKLPSNIDLNVPERGVETVLIGYIEDPSKPTEPAVWFNFDRLTFETASATLKPESMEQLKNTAEILKAYPNVKVKIGGYTDNVGGPDANLQLSQARATNVMNAIIALGIAPDRVTAEGYGEQHPVADNSTEDGRAQNRRIAIRVTQK